MINEVKYAIESTIVSNIKVDIKKAVLSYKEPGLRGMTNLYKAHCTSCDKFFLSIEDCVLHFKEIHGCYKV